MYVQCGRGRTTFLDEKNIGIHRAYCAVSIMYCIYRSIRVGRRFTTCCRGSDIATFLSFFERTWKTSPVDQGDLLYHPRGDRLSRLVEAQRRSIARIPAHTSPSCGLRFHASTNSHRMNAGPVYRTL